MTRATHHLFRGDLIQALRYNGLVIVTLLGVVAAWSAWLSTAAGRPPLRGREINTWVPAIAVAALVAFAVIRNATTLPLTG